MTRAWSKFVLLMWKNFTLQRRFPMQTAIEILIPVLFASFLLVIRILVTVDQRPGTHFKEFNPIQEMKKQIMQDNSNILMIGWTHNSKVPQEWLQSIVENAVGYLADKKMPIQYFSSETEMVKMLTKSAGGGKVVGIVFSNSIRNKCSGHLKMKLRFPGELQDSQPPNPEENWKTNVLEPMHPLLGPREHEKNKLEDIGDASPGYQKEGFLALQEALTMSLFKVCTGQDLRQKYTLSLKRYPYPAFVEDIFLTTLQSSLPLLMMLSFMYTCKSTVKAVATEKEKQLKEAMKIMGLPGWLHWLAWFTKTFLFLLISVLIIVILMKVSWKGKLCVFTHSNPLLLFVFMMFYAAATTCFSFMMSVFFSKANTASMIAGLGWFLSYMPYMFMEGDYENLSLSTILLSSLACNSAMGYGFQLFIRFEGTGDGLQWNDIMTPAVQSDNLTMAHIMFMFLVDCFLYMLITVYIETVFPGDYGVPKPWYFPLQKSFWFGPSKYTDSSVLVRENSLNAGKEEEPQNLPAGIKIINLRKVFHNTTVAVDNLSLNMYEGQITVLLGHNGAGKTTTMSMLTGLYVPTSGTAIVDGYDICTDIDGVRDSLGLCPQHDVLFDELTVREHLYYFGKLKGLTGSELDSEIERYIGLLELEPKENAQVKTLSGGMKRKLSAGVALCGKSKVVMFDEPTSGMDPAARRALWELLRQERHGRTILLTTHFMDEADLLGDRIAIMAAGKLKCCGTSFFLKKKYGAGYHLVIAKDENCDVGKVTKVLQNHIPRVHIEQNIGTELSYLLSENDSVHFEAMFTELERKKETLHITSYGMSLSTLEEVFMKVGKDEEVSLKGSKNTYESREEYSMRKRQHVSEDDSKTTRDLESKSWQTLLVFPSTVREILELLEMTSIVKTPESNEKLRLYTIPRICNRYLHQTSLQSVNNLITITHGVDMPDSSISLLAGCMLKRNQIQAMVKKKLLVYLRSLGQFLIQCIVPVLFLSLGLLMSKINVLSKDLPALNIDLQKYSHTHTLVAGDQRVSNENGIFSSYKNIISGVVQVVPFRAGPVDDVTNEILKQSEKRISVVSRSYITGASFETISNGVKATGWFNGQVYHSPPLALNLLSNAILRNANISRLAIINHPLPFTARSKVNLQMGSNTMSFQIAFNIGFGMALTTAFFAIFPIKERITKAKHIQFVSGVDVIIFWATSLLCDFVMFLVGALAIIVALAAFQEEGYATVKELGRMFLILLCFAWSVIPFTYLLSMMYNQPVTGYARISMINTLLGVSTFAVILVLQAPGLNFQKIAIVLDWIFMVVPHYTLCISIKSLYDTFLFNKYCKDVIPYCGLIEHRCCQGSSPHSINYFDWKDPGIGRRLLFFAVTGILYLILLLLMDMGMLDLYKRFMARGVTAAPSNDNLEEDSDVADEKEKIRAGDMKQLKKDYTLVLKDVTKYYKNLLAVDHLHLGVPAGECFGLLGVNGAGKTTTFKMLTGDEKISEGEGYVNGWSLTTQIRKVHQVIGYCPQFDALIDDLTGRETMHLFCLLRGVRTNECSQVINQLAEELLFKKHIDKKVKEYSGGNKRKLSTAVALVGNPPVVYLDEPTTGMDPVAKRHLWNVIVQARNRGKSIILTSHSMEECEALCTRLAIMVNGKFRCLGSVQHLKSKFADGCMLTIKVKKRASTVPKTSSDEIQLVKTFITRNYPGATLKEEFQSLLTYHIPATKAGTTKKISWGKMFGTMERAKQELQIEDYSLGQTSLEQIFLSFTKFQRDEKQSK